MIKFTSLYMDSTCKQKLNDFGYKVQWFKQMMYERRFVKRISETYIHISNCAINKSDVFIFKILVHIVIKIDKNRFRYIFKTRHCNIFRLDFETSSCNLYNSLSSPLPGTNQYWCHMKKHGRD
jgi:hypothetical protein